MSGQSGYREAIEEELTQLIDSVDENSQVARRKVAVITGVLMGVWATAFAVEFGVAPFEVAGVATFSVLILFAIARAQRSGDAGAMGGVREPNDDRVEGADDSTSPSEAHN